MTLLTQKRQNRFWYWKDGRKDRVASRGASTKDLIIKTSDRLLEKLVINSLDLSPNSIVYKSVVAV